MAMKSGGPPPKGLANRKNSGTLCKATRRDGSPCTNFAMNGSSVCRLHGGAAPQVRRAAQVRLLMSAETLMGELLKIALDEKQPVAVRLQAIRDGLDRAGLGSKQELDVNVHGMTRLEEVEADILIDVAQPGDAFYNVDVIDAEIVDEAHERAADQAMLTRDRDRSALARRSTRRRRSQT